MEYFSHELLSFCWLFIKLHSYIFSENKSNIVAGILLASWAPRQHIFIRFGVTFRCNDRKLCCHLDPVKRLKLTINDWSFFNEIFFFVIVIWGLTLPVYSSSHFDIVDDVMITLNEHASYFATSNKIFEWFFSFNIKKCQLILVYSFPISQIDNCQFPIEQMRGIIFARWDTITKFWMFLKISTKSMDRYISGLAY